MIYINYFLQVSAIFKHATFEELSSSDQEGEHGEDKGAVAKTKLQETKMDIQSISSDDDENEEDFDDHHPEDDDGDYVERDDSDYVEDDDSYVEDNAGDNVEDNACEYLFKETNIY